MNEIKLSNKIDTLFISSKNIGKSDPRRLLLNLEDKINLKRNE